MYNLGGYPAILKGAGTITVDVYKIDKWFFKQIDMMERMYGYYSVEEKIGDMEGTLYVYRFELPESLRIESGNWLREMIETKGGIF